MPKTTTPRGRRTGSCSSSHGWIDECVQLGSRRDERRTARDARPITGTSGSQQPDWQPIPPSYPRPKGATPVSLSLVPASQQCTSPNRTHGPPLAFGSCKPPQRASSYLTVGTPDANGQAGRLHRVAACGSDRRRPRAPTDEADVRLSLSLTDVRLASRPRRLHRRAVGPVRRAPHRQGEPALQLDPGHDGRPHLLLRRRMRSHRRPRGRHLHAPRPPLTRSSPAPSRRAGVRSGSSARPASSTAARTATPPRTTTRCSRWAASSSRRRRPRRGSAPTRRMSCNSAFQCGVFPLSRWNSSAPTRSPANAARSCPSTGSSARSCSPSSTSTSGCAASASSTSPRTAPCCWPRTTAASRTRS